MGAKGYRFADFELDLERYELRLDGCVQKIERIPLDLLIMLVESRGKLVARDSIVDHLWGKDFFLKTENSVNTAINKVRRVLVDNPDDPQFVQTVVGKGYRFIAQVEVIAQVETIETERPADPPAAIAPVIVVEDNAESSPVHVEFEATTALPVRHRYRSVLSVGFGLIILAVVAYFSYRASHDDRSAGNGVASRIRSLAVLPLVSLSQNAEQEYFAEGMTDELISNLALATPLRVISRTSIIQFKGTNLSLPAVAKALDVDAVVEGTVLRSGDRVRISAQLLDARRDQHLWAKVYDRQGADILSVQQEVTADISSQVAAALSPGKELPRTTNTEAYDQFLRGLYLWNQQSTSGIQNSLECFNRAIDLDPNYALAHVARANSHLSEYRVGLRPPAEALSLARTDAQTALKLDRSLGRAHAVLGQIADDEWDWNAAGPEFEQAIALDPNNESAHSLYSRHLQVVGRLEDALAEARRAQKIDPLGQLTAMNLGYALFLTGHHDERFEIAQRTQQLYPDSPQARLNLAFAFLQRGMKSEALAEVDKTEKFEEVEPVWQAVLANIYGRTGQRERANLAISRLLKVGEKSPVQATDVAFAYLGLGENSKALDWLERGFAEHDPAMRMLMADPDYLPLRPDPRFKELVRRMNLPT